MRRFLAILTASLVGVVGLPTPAGAHVSEALYEARMVRRINEATGLNLERSACLDRHAQAYADRLAGGFRFDHLSRSIGATMTDCESFMLGEVLASGEARPRLMVEAWFRSPTHKAVLMRRQHHYIGVGVVRMADRWMVVVRLADRSS